MSRLRFKLGLPGYILPVRSRLLSTGQEGAMARSVNINTQSSQSRINPTDSICRACGEETGNMIHRQCPGIMFCKESQKVMGKHFSLAVYAKVKSGFGGQLFAKHALLMPRYLPQLTSSSKQDFKWLREDAPKKFRGNVHMEGSTTSNHVFPEARRSGYGAVIIADDLPESTDEEDITQPADEQYVPENDPAENSLGMPVTNEQSQHKEAVSITHSANKWPITVRVNPLINEIRRVAATTTVRINDNDVKAKGVPGSPKYIWGPASGCFLAFGLRLYFRLLASGCILRFWPLAALWP